MNTTNTAAETFEVVGAWSDKYYEREERGYAEIPEGAEPCVVCGRLVKAGKGFDVHFIFGGRDAVRNDLEAEAVAGYTEGGDMGIWKIGPECGKAVPAAYRKAVAE